MFKLLLVLMSLAGICFGQVTTTEYYDNRRCAVMWTADDLNTNGDPWGRFWDAANLAASNHIVFTAGVIVGQVSSNGWSEIRSAMDGGYFMPVTHSWQHPTTNINYELEYITAHQVMITNLNLPWQKTYNGQKYDPFYVQWGGAEGNIDYNITLSLMGSNNFLAIRTYSPKTPTPWPLWNNAANLYVQADGYRWLQYTVGGDEILNGSYSNDFDAAYSDGTLYLVYNHPYEAAQWVYGTNAAVWTKFFAYVGNRKDVWYTDPASLLTYHYLQNESPPDITVSNVAGDLLISVSGDHAAREKYGLSYPLTYKVTKPADWISSSGVYVYYRDPAATNWMLMDEKTTNDFFTGINAYRNAGDVVYVSQGLPQTTDMFDLLIKPGRLRWFIQRFVYDYNRFYADIIMKEKADPVLQYTTNLLNQVWTDFTPSGIETNMGMLRLYINLNGVGPAGYFRAIQESVP